MRNLFLIVIMSTLFLGSSIPMKTMAQTSTGTSGIRRGVAVVMFTSLAGAVLGLSTLSFYGEPQEHIGNIWAGMALGALAGGGYVFSRSYKYTDHDQQWPTNPHQQMAFHRPILQYQFEF